MFSHIMVGANDVNASKVFYDAILGELGHEPGVIDEKGRCFYFTDTGIFSISKPINGEKACNGNGSTIGFAATSPEQADACEDAPGVREAPAGKLYLAYLRDPSGNKLCALHRVG